MRNEEKTIDRNVAMNFVKQKTTPGDISRTTPVAAAPEPIKTPRKSTAKRSTKQPNPAPLAPVVARELRHRLTTRLNSSLIKRLKEESFHRKMAGDETSMIEEILDAAASEWLNKNARYT